MIQGETVGTRSVTTTSSRPLTIRVIRPTSSADNVKAVAATIADWQDLARTYERSGVPPKVPSHAHFAADTLFIAAKEMRVNPENVLIAVSDGTIEGASVYNVKGDEGHISVFTTSPRNQPEVPGERTRGVGSALLDNTVQQMRAKGAQRVTLRPLDLHADRFWRRKGFNSSLPGQPLSAPINAVTCHEDDDGELEAYDPEEIAKVRMPRVSAKYGSF